jgi:hypothetical protein
MKNGSAARKDLSKGRKSSAISVAMARKGNDSRSALSDQHPCEPRTLASFTAHRPDRHESNKKWRSMRTTTSMALPQLRGRSVFENHFEVERSLLSWFNGRPCVISRTNSAAAESRHAFCCSLVRFFDAVFVPATKANISLASFRRAIHSLGTALLVDGEAANWGLTSAACLSTRYHHHPQ